ncbi:MAG: hypothetical protein ACRBCJ_06715 [Hyphomicrobiaceae bacterium]
MRTIVAVLAIVAIGKIYVHYNFYRTAADRAIIAAYRDTAIAACRSGQSNMPSQTAAYLWSQPRSIKVRVGKPDLSVSMWDINHPKWAERYKHANLVLAPHDPHTLLTCRFNLTTGQASISNV